MKNILSILLLLTCIGCKLNTDLASPAIDNNYPTLDITTSEGTYVGLADFHAFKQGEPFQDHFVRLNLYGEGTVNIVSKDCGIDFYNVYYKKEVILPLKVLMGNDVATTPCQFRFIARPKELPVAIYGIVTVPVLPSNVEPLDFSTDTGDFSGILSVKKLATSTQEPQKVGFGRVALDPLSIFYKFNNIDFNRSFTTIVVSPLTENGVLEIRSSKNPQNVKVIEYNSKNPLVIPIDTFAKVHGQSGLSSMTSDTFILTDTPFDVSIKTRMAFVVLEVAEKKTLVLPIPQYKFKSHNGEKSFCVTNTDRVAYTIINGKVEVDSNQCVKAKNQYVIVQISTTGYLTKCFYYEGAFACKF